LIQEAQIALAARNAVGSVVAGSGLYRRGSTGPGYGAFMEPSGRNPWQPVATSSAAKTAQIRETVSVGCDQRAQDSGELRVAQSGQALDDDVIGLHCAAALERLGELREREGFKISVRAHAAAR